MLSNALICETVPVMVTDAVPLPANAGAAAAGGDVERALADRQGHGLAAATRRQRH